MRTEDEMMDMMMQFAENDKRVRLVTLEGSRTNKNVPKDLFQDYDISFFVTEMDSFKENDHWLDVFGERIFMQKPEDMELFPPELGNWFSYLMLFSDGNRIDLTLIPLNEVEDYFRESDGLVEILLDKDNRIKEKVIPIDQKYWIQKPSDRKFDDCCNEFWWVSTYVVKGLARKEILFALDHLNEIVRPNLLRMMSWQIGIERGFTFSLGKNYKYIEKYLPKDDWVSLLSTFSLSDYKDVWESLFTCYKLFRKYSISVSDQLGYPYPNYDDAITKYTQDIYKSLIQSTNPKV
ncbi:aminoglycoside 6-adenylyltransferase [Gracilibacillus halotolerans]|uniref:aminoglycoside 6-adenylyltransferase n=1 Tax=Gracilibacillus halotolerans TaxID=74386 RepID=UPI00161A058A|nr:aminoglycoside 6-adenylyltransferase [Gracilibacillus halotolerans]